MPISDKKKPKHTLKINTKNISKKPKTKTDTLCELKVDQFGNIYCIPVCQSCPTPSELLRNKIKDNILHRRTRRYKIIHYT